MSLDYVARCPKCNCVVAAVSCDHMVELIAKDISRWARLHLSVDRMETEDVRTADWGHGDECKLKNRKAEAV